MDKILYSVLMEDDCYVYVRLYDTDYCKVEDKKIHYSEFEEWQIGKVEM